MKAIMIDEFGPPSVFKEGELDKPEPLHNEAVIEIHAAGLNPFDCKMRVGKLNPFFKLGFPQVIGWDFAGVVADKGFDVDEVEIGDKVYGMGSPIRYGATAEYMAVQAAFCRPIPEGMSFEEAAGIPMAGQTAWHGLFSQANVKQGDRVLIQAGAGGVGQMAIQIAKAQGAWVATTCSTRNVDFCKELGADQVIDYTKEDFVEALDGKTIDVALDVLGGEVNLRTYEVLKSGATYLCVLRYDKADAENRDRLSKEHNVNVHTVVFSNKPWYLDELSKLYTQGKLQVPVTETIDFSAEAMAKAHEQLETGHTRGKIIMKVK